ACVGPLACFPFSGAAVAIVAAGTCAEGASVTAGTIAPSSGARATGFAGSGAFTDAGGSVGPTGAAAAAAGPPPREPPPRPPPGPPAMIATRLRRRSPPVVVRPTGGIVPGARIVPSMPGDEVAVPDPGGPEPMTPLIRSTEARARSG